MGETHYGNAMTEVALALAMAFFSIMILAMVSMGAAHNKAASDDRQNADTSIAAKLAPSKNSSPSAETAATQDDTLIIYHKGTYFDRNVKAVDPATINPSGRIILAISPDTAMSEALEARSQLNTENLIVSMLSPSWLATLNRRQLQEK